MSLTAALAKWWLKRAIKKQVKRIRKEEENMNGAIVRMVRSAVTTGLAAWWSVAQGNPKYLASIPLVHGLFKWLRDKYPTNTILNLLPF